MVFLELPVGELTKVLMRGTLAEDLSVYEFDST